MCKIVQARTGHGVSRLIFVKEPLNDEHVLVVHVVNDRLYQTPAPSTSSTRRVEFVRRRFYFFLQRIRRSDTSSATTLSQRQTSEFSMLSSRRSLLLFHVKVNATVQYTYWHLTWAAAYLLDNEVQVSFATIELCRISPLIVFHAVGNWSTRRRASRICLQSVIKEPRLRCRGLDCIATIPVV